MRYIQYRYFRFCVTHSKFPPQVLTEREIIKAILSAVYVYTKNEEKPGEEVLYIGIVAGFVGSWWSRY